VLRRSLDGLYASGAVLAALCVLAILALMIAASIGRVMEWRVSWVNDVVAWLCAASAFLGMAYSFRNGDFVRVTLVLESASPTARWRLELASLLVAAVAIGYLAWWAVAFTWESWVFGDVAGGMVPIPMWMPQLSFAVGALIFWVAVLDECARVLTGAKPSYTVLVEQRHARGDFSQEL
jgi:TRAP-type C4-dicarboxylate transport system permease small subunit